MWPHRQIPVPIMLMQVSPRQMAQVFSCIMCIQRHAFQMLQRSVLNSCVRCSLTFAYFFWPFSFVTIKDLTSRSDKLVQQSGSTPKSVLSHQFPCLCLLTVPGHFVFPFSPLQIVDTFDRLLPPAEGLKQCWRRAVKNNTGGAVVTSRWSFCAFALRVEKARTVLNVILVLKKCPSAFNS